MKLFGLVMWTTAAAITAYALFYVSYRVQNLEEQLAGVNREILKEQETIHILEAEWSYLNRPERLQKLTEDLLPEMVPLDATQFVSMDAIPFRAVDAPEGATADAQSDQTNPNFIKPAAHQPGGNQ